MKVETTRGYGRVRNPLTGEDINVEGVFEADEELYEALDAEYSGFRIVEEDPDDECADEGCSRTVRDGGYCWQHEPGDDGGGE